MKSISNRTYADIKDVLLTFSQLRGSNELAQAITASTRVANARRRAARILKKLAAADKFDPRKVAHK